ncbi:MAG: J domain-containing protein [Pegethrix bostrychoides GSE-TBD4-15B]|jgi:tetratricopeptide (TPR) repeat protein|uniref:J domain-containing protein n=1 Tax=Pegethrix bostrychoides GSE-TBD4-15B TaxID=2839662 RepID=A0A951P6Y2_9CYAN|nr:J domain-containing protein [Pegethrix bostrychoides GSE-TBD4-15B]
MTQLLFSPEWLNLLTDPYAVLGISVAADERRVLKRYRSVAKLLHPDSLIQVDPATMALASQLLARLVNPAYQRLKQEKERAETVAMLRIRVRRMSREETGQPQSAVARRLLNLPLHKADIYYEQSVTELAEQQYQQFEQFESITAQLSELHLAYLRLKMGEPVIREKRTGIVAAPQAKPIQFAPGHDGQVSVNYAQRHYYRAQEYAKKATWLRVVAELRDAIVLEPDRAEYHSLLAQAYLMQNLTGMAKVHFRQALKFNPRDPLAIQYAERLHLLEPEKVAAKAGGLFSLFGKKR